MPTEVNFKSLADSLHQPLKDQTDSLINANLSCFGRAEQLHVGFCAILAFYAKHNALPAINNEEHAKEVVALAQTINAEKKAKNVLNVEKLEEGVIRNMARFAGAEITSMCSFFGGVAAQEGYKMVGKYNPLRQWLHYDCFESLPADDSVNRKVLGGRYDDIIAIYGKEIFAKLQDLKLLMIGAGALGCEFVKAFAMMGVSTGKGLLTLTDNDHIELSNLSRQFLFRQKDIGKSKSEIAGKAAVVQNPKFNVKTMQEFVAPQTEHIFTEDMWDGLDMVIGAVDNIKARMYVDSKCVWHHKPYLDSGTLGPKANTQVVMPKLTQSYADTMDPQEESFPMCTIRNFPNLIEHTIEWGRSQFEGLFSDTPKNAADYVKDAESFLKRIKQGTTITGTIDVVKNILELIKLKRKNSFDACVAFAREKFQEHFNYTIAQLLNTFPADYKDEHGIPFWSGPKRAPCIIEYDPKDELHVLYVQSTAVILAGALKIKANPDRSYISKVAGGILCPPFVPKKVAITVDDKQPAQEQLLGNEEDDLDRLLKELKALSAGLKESDFLPVEFEKDDDTNFHVDCIHATANLRARNYKIPECDKLKTRGVAGHIIPAIATATAMIVGCVCNEMFKVVQKMSKLECYKNAFVNLALPLFVFSEPMVVCGELPLFMAGMSPKDRLNKRIETIVEEVSKSKLGPTVKTLRLDVMGETNDKRVSAVLPGIRYTLHNA